MNAAGLTARLACVARTWTRRQRLHPGDVAWAHAHGDGSTPADVTLSWGDPLAGFADVWHSGAASLHLAPGAPVADAVGELLRAAPRPTLEVSLEDTVLVEALTSRGFRRCEGPWFTKLWRSLDDPSDLAVHPVPAGYSIRPVRADEVDERAELHRRCWAPARIRRLLGLPVTGDEAGSGYSADRHRAVMATPIYRPGLDMVAVTPGGSFAAYALGWLDVASGSVLFEPVGTAPEHAGRGLARALCAELLRTARDLGASQAVVSARGDSGYPVPRRLYEGLGMREAARVVSFARD